MMAMEYKPLFPRPCPSSTTTTTSSSSMKTLITLPSLISSFHGIRIHSRCSKSAAPVSCRGVGGSMMIRASKRAEEVKELRGRTTEELNEEVIDLKGELFMLRLQRSARNEFKSSEFRRMHKRIARMLTIKREREIEEGVGRRLSRKLDKKMEKGYCGQTTSIFEEAAAGRSAESSGERKAYIDPCLLHSMQ